jgi:hypothetical protein
MDVKKSEPEVKFREMHTIIKLMVEIFAKGRINIFNSVIKSPKIICYILLKKALWRFVRAI